MGLAPRRMRAWWAYAALPVLGLSCPAWHVTQASAAWNPCQRISPGHRAACSAALLQTLAQVMIDVLANMEHAIWAVLDLLCPVWHAPQASAAWESC